MRRVRPGVVSHRALMRLVAVNNLIRGRDLLVLLGSSPSNVPLTARDTTSNRTTYTCQTQAQGMRRQVVGNKTSKMQLAMLGTSRAHTTKAEGRAPAVRLCTAKRIPLRPFCPIDWPPNYLRLQLGWRGCRNPAAGRSVVCTVNNAVEIHSELMHSSSEMSTFTA